ncbi:AcrR family transcriptional regulator [Saccharomonospora amisosensis]|uniref:AcrR family transcriptional regulator n=1 Tax=Saccharomonospora amisosensis TaxID=1128677 RepID=A0A7X5UP19_9PSEU|nr:TetR/AcrR family transcriptional regulator [Saccharomonospora amisosensis]NIJ11476.1 AcrR family transcriptional regulator [Saccharomonospora amisosensis]
MVEQRGLRERKKVTTRRLLATVALDLFEERGFDNVQVAEIAAAAQVSKKTVFNYFEVKEDLVLGSGKHHITEPATVVRERPPGQTPHAAIREYLLTALAERQPMTGLTDHPDIPRIQRLVRTTPALAVRQMQYREQSRQLLATALVEEGASALSAELMATQILGAQQVVIAEIGRRVSAGEKPDDVYPDAVTVTRHAFRWLERGLGDTLRRPASSGD